MNQPWDISEDMFLSEDEVEQLTTYLRGRGDTTGVVDRVIVEGLLFSGLRTSEFCRLRVADTVAGHGAAAFRVVEGTREPRTVHLSRETNELVADYTRTVRHELVKGEIDDADSALILNTRGRPYERTSLYRRVVKILTAAGFGDRASVQLLRHTYGFLAYKRTGGNLLFVQRQLGHAHPMVTAIYAKFVEESYDDLADRVGSSPPTTNRPSRRSRR